MNRLLGCFFVVASSVAYSLQASAQTVSVPVTQDTWIDGLGSATVNGGDPALGLCPGARYWTYLKFDLSGLAGEVVSAELRMTRISGARPEEISVYLIEGDSWTEADLTGQTRPAPTDPLDSSRLATGQITGSGYDRWLSPALTAAVRQEALGDRVLSLMVRENFVNMIDIRYYRSREAAVSSANKPQLVVTTMAADPCGDPNSDGRITASDALAALHAAVGSETCSLWICDFNGDGKVSAADALAILKKAVGQDVAPQCPEESSGLLPSTPSESSTMPTTSSTLPTDP